MKEIKRIKKPKPEKIEVESHGDLISQEEIPIPEPTEVKTENVQAEDVNPESIEDHFNNPEMKKQMKEQVERMKQKEKLKYDLISGKITADDLTEEQLADLDL